MVYRKTQEMTRKPSNYNVLQSGLIRLNLKRTGQEKCNHTKELYFLKRL